jgi:pyridinium-3,5-biscarboxylic acid mononucleotide sulfurtransferase
MKQDRHLSGQREQHLAALLTGYGSVCIGYSGGVDSAFLAVTATRVLGPEQVLAVTGLSAAYPHVQRQQAVDCVERFGIPHLEIDTFELSDASYAANPTNRCYYCKLELWSRLRHVAADGGYAVVCDGSNADDARDYRPGMQAAAEHGVRSPLMEAGLTKADIRTLSRAFGLPTWDAPASPCLSSRLPYGVAVTPERLRAVEYAEDALRTLGLREFRVRHHGDAARVETSPDEFAAVAAAADAIVTAAEEAGFARVLFDVEGYRRGALNEGLGLIGIARQRAAVPALAGAAETLRRAGLPAEISEAGQDADILVVRAPIHAAPRVAALAPQLKAAGYRYIAIEPRPRRAA